MERRCIEVTVDLPTNYSEWQLNNLLHKLFQSYGGKVIEIEYYTDFNNHEEE